METSIRTKLDNLTSSLPESIIAARQTNPLKRLWNRAMNRRNRKRTIRYSLLAANLLLLVVVAAFVTRGNSSPQLIQRRTAGIGGDSSVQGNPLDPLSAADIAVHVARMTRLPEATAVVNEADSVNALLAVATGDDKILTKPQVVSTDLKSIKDLKVHVAASGETVSGLASRFGITSDSIRWSNDLTGEFLTAGTELWIPPVNGIVYLVRSTDTPEGIASRFRANKDKIIAFNDAEISGLQAGQRIVIPDGSVTVIRPTITYQWFGSGTYDRGWCTDYASVRGGVPGGWGNANTWDNYAPLSGWIVSKVPVVGAVAQTDVGWAGHVGIVDAVSEDGTMIKYSDMNGLAGFGRVGYSDWVPANAKFQNYIYKY